MGGRLSSFDSRAPEVSGKNDRRDRKQYDVTGEGGRWGQGPEGIHQSRGSGFLDHRVTRYSTGA